jgi:hypothetical protein
MVNGASLFIQIRYFEICDAIVWTITFLSWGLILMTVSRGQSLGRLIPDCLNFYKASALRLFFYLFHFM